MNKKIFFYLFFLLANLYANAQMERSVWRMGFYPCDGNPFEMDFNSGHLVINSLPNSNIMSLSFLNAGICDKNGKLLFYTNGIYVANSQHDTMENGSGLNPCQYTSYNYKYGIPVSQGAIVLPDPADTSEYYLFHSDMNTNNLSSSALLVTKIDMSFNSGLGKVIYKNIPEYAQSLIAGQLTAVKHANGRDWWLVLHHRETNEYVLFLLSTNGLNPPMIQAIGHVYRNPVYALFSPDGKKYAATYDDGRYVDLFNFNRCTGVLSNLMHLKMPGNEKAFGCSFSKKSQLFYVSTQYNIYQYNLIAPDIAGSITQVSTWDSIPDPFSATFHHQQLGPDGKIYLTGLGGSYYLNVINFPDNLGPACDVRQHSIAQHGQSHGNFPNYPFYDLKELNESVCDSLIDNVNTPSKNENDVYIFPNPFKDNINILGNISNNGKIIIRNSIGKIVYNENYSVSKINLSSLTEGLYFFTLERENKIYHQKVLKIN